MDQSQGEKKPSISRGITNALRPRADAGRLIGIEDVLEACEATPENHSPGQARLVLRWGGWEIHFHRFFPFRHANRHDANSAPWLGSDSYCPALDLLSDEFLDFGQVSVRFEFPPAGFVYWVNHRFVLSTGRW